MAIKNDIEVDLLLLQDVNTDLSKFHIEQVMSTSIDLKDSFINTSKSLTNNVIVYKNAYDCIIMNHEANIQVLIKKANTNSIQKVLNNIREFKNLPIIDISIINDTNIKNGKLTKRTKHINIIKTETIQVKTLAKENESIKYTHPILYKLQQYEQRFLEVANLDTDIKIYPITQTENTQVETDKEKSNEFSEVFTPLWLVDNMIEKLEFDWTNDSKQTLDLCSGYGQFTIRMLRKKYSVLGESFDIDKFLNDTHWFNELQISSCFKLLYIFGNNINICIGDSMKLLRLDNDDSGILYYYSETNTKGAWINIDAFINKLLNKYNTIDMCDKFSNRLEKELNMVKTIDLYNRKVKYGIEKDNRSNKTN